MWKYFFCLVLPMTLIGCSDEVVDQIGHEAAGSIMTKDLMRNSDNPPSTAKTLVMSYAICREAHQSEEELDGCPTSIPEIPGHWGHNKRRDLKHWEKGIDSAIRSNR